MITAQHQHGHRKACPECGEVMFRDCNSDETEFFWSCTECDYSEKQQVKA